VTERKGEKPGCVYSLWTQPATEWTNILSALDTTDEAIADLLDQVSEEQRRQLAERVKPFKTPVTRSTLSKCTK